MWRMKDVEVIPVVIGELGTVTKQFEKWIQKLDLEITVEMLQKSIGHEMKIERERSYNT